MCRQILDVKTRVLIAIAFAAWLTLLGCSVNVKKDDAGNDKKVDITTPLASIRVDKEAEGQDTGLTVYPGARIQPKTSNNDKQASVDLSFMGYGVKVVAVEYVSEDAPAKIIAFYKDQLKKYGNVLECHAKDRNLTVDPNNDSDNLSCDSSQGKTVELKVGRKSNQHIVAIDADGAGSKFSLVHVQTRSGGTI